MTDETTPGRVQTAAEELTEAVVRLDRALRKQRENEMRSIAQGLNVIASVIEKGASRG